MLYLYVFISEENLNLRLSDTLFDILDYFKQVYLG